MPGDLNSAIIVPWLALDITGQWCLFALLVTFAVVKHLPQRTNPFLVNFILTTFLATIPPSMLLYAGEQFNTVSNNLCFAQAALVDGVSPMFGVAQLALIFDTWCELRSVCSGRQPFTRKLVPKHFLISAPYIAMWLWTFASFIAAAQSHASHDASFAYCRNESSASSGVRNAFSFFMAGLGIVEIILAAWVGWTIYRRLAEQKDDPTAWRTTMHFAFRVLILSIMQFIVLLVIIADIWINSTVLKVSYELLTSMDALATFFAFATQKNVLQAWKFWGKKEKDAFSNQIEARNYSTFGFKKFDGDDFEHEEQGDTVSIKGTKH